MVLTMTGHRPERLGKGYDKNTHSYNIYHPFYMTLGMEIRNFILDNEVSKLVSGMAKGSDTLAALVFLRLRRDFPELNLFLECALPCKNQALYWNYEEKKLYDSILHKANKVTYVSHKDYFHGCMKDRDKYMVDIGNEVLGIFDGIETGGTWITIKYARKQGKKVSIINPKEVLLCL